MMKNQLLHQSVSIIIQLHQELKANSTISSQLAQTLIDTAQQIERVQKQEQQQFKYVDYSKDESVQKTIKNKRTSSQIIVKVQSPQCKEIFSRECLQELILPYLNLKDLISFRCVNSVIQESIKQYVKQYLVKEEKSLAHHLFSSYYLASLKDYLYSFLPKVKWLEFDHIQAKKNISKYYRDFEILKKVRSIPQQYEQIFDVLLLIFQGQRKVNISSFEQFKKLNLKQSLKYENIIQNIDLFNRIDEKVAKKFSIELHNTILLCQSLISLYYLENIFTIGSSASSEQHQFNQISYYYKYHSDLINFWKKVTHQDQKFQLFLNFSTNKVNLESQNLSDSKCYTDRINILILCLSYCDDNSLLKFRLINKQFKIECELQLEDRLVFSIQAFEFAKLYQNRQLQCSKHLQNELGFFNPLFDMAYTFLIDKHQELVQFNNFEYIKQCDDEFTFYINTAYTQLHNLNNLRSVLAQKQLLRITKTNLNPFNKKKQSIQLAAHALQNLSTLVQNNPKISYNFQILYPLYLYLKLFIIIQHTILPTQFDSNETVVYLYNECIKYLNILFKLGKLSTLNMRNIINQSLEYFDQNQKQEIAQRLNQQFFQVYTNFKSSLDSREKTLEILTEITAIFESMNIFLIEKITEYDFLQFDSIFTTKILNYLTYTDLINFACTSSQSKKLYITHLQLRIENEANIIRTFEKSNKQSLQSIQKLRPKLGLQKDKAVQLVQQFTISDLSELKAFNHPTQAFEIFCRPLLILFDLQQKSNTNYWTTLKSFLLQQNSWSQISDFPPETLSRQKVNQIKQILKSPKFDLVVLAKLSSPLLKFINWLQGILILHSYLRQYCLGDKEENLSEEQQQLFTVLDIKQCILYKAMRYINQNK
ncbi:unnamed protein product [Paramecium primaurelia]|uniref:Uncharacterized protein n=1 Tax=Paramecium primaurelia TaxID=5886 RepID=A0A8S1LJF0_PARPR|nr:unnamed protein product [Paramecium primaurelia]